MSSLATSLVGIVSLFYLFSGENEDRQLKKLMQLV